MLCRLTRGSIWLGAFNGTSRRARTGAAGPAGKTTAQIIDICVRWRPTGEPTLLGVAEAVRSLARRIRDLRAEPETHEDRIEELVKAWRLDSLQLDGGLSAGSRGGKLGTHSSEHASRDLHRGWAT